MIRFVPIVSKLVGAQERTRNLNFQSGTTLTELDSTISDLSLSMEAATAVYLAPSLPFPITIHRLLRPSTQSHSVNSALIVNLKTTEIQKTQSLFTYSFAGNTGIREVRMWECPISGVVEQWCVQEGAIIKDSKSVFCIVLCTRLKLT